MRKLGRFSVTIVARTAAGRYAFSRNTVGDHGPDNEAPVKTCWLLDSTWPINASKNTSTSSLTSYFRLKNAFCCTTSAPVGPPASVRWLVIASAPPEIHDASDSVPLSKGTIALPSSLKRRLNNALVAGTPPILPLTCSPAGATHGTVKRRGFVPGGSAA